MFRCFNMAFFIICQHGEGCNAKTVPARMADEAERNTGGHRRNIRKNLHTYTKLDEAPLRENELQKYDNDSEDEDEGAVTSSINVK